MKYLAAYMLCVLGGNDQPSQADVTKVLSAVDAKIDDAKMEKLFAELSGKDLDELIAAGLNF